MPEVTFSDDLVDTATQLLASEEADAFSYLGIQAERFELAETRAAKGRPVPEWEDTDALNKVLSDQRAPWDELIEYAAKGRAFALSLLGRVEDDLRARLCKDGEVAPGVRADEKDHASLIKDVATIVGVLLATSLPGAIVKALASIAATLAVILLRRGLNRFCEVGVAAIAD